MTADLRSGARRRVALYAVSPSNGRVDAFVDHALQGVRTLVERLIVVVPRATADDDRARIAQIADVVVEYGRTSFSADLYADALTDLTDLGDFDELVLTGDSWYGPVHDLAVVVDRLDALPAGIRGMIEVAQPAATAFSAAGFPQPVLPWQWTAVDRSVFASAHWRAYWGDGRAGVAEAERERDLFEYFAARGLDVAFAFPASQLPSADAAVFAPGFLLDAGCPLVGRRVFQLFPPFLDRFAVIGRELLRAIEGTGFPIELVWQNLARTIPTKALYAIGGMLEVLPDEDVAYDSSRALKIAAIVHVSDFEHADDLFSKLGNLPSPYDLFVTTTDGGKGARIQRMLEKREDPHRASFDVRVTPADRGRDMSDFFVGCRDVLLSGDYDVIVKVHARRMGDATVNLRRYFRRYHVDNLLGSPGYTANVLALFQREPGLGAVFPPMMHIGTGLMGRGWSDVRDAARDLCSRLGITVPLDVVSPHAPFGGMWIFRPEALTPLTSHRWRYSDYKKRAGHQYRDLARLQERLIASAAAEQGYHSRSVLTREHASISHTMLESKVDNLFSTTRGWPVEQIDLMQRAGYVGHGGVVALTRMYIRINHPRIARVVMPVFDLGLRSFVAVGFLRRGVRRMLSVWRGRTPGGIS